MIGAMKIIFLISAAVLCSAVWSGCVATPDGHSAPGLPNSDTIVRRYQRPVPQIAAATVTVLNHDGKLLVDNVVNNTFKARINESTVWVKVSDVDGKVSEVKVEARGGFGGDIQLAAQVAEEIALQLQATPAP